MWNPDQPEAGVAGAVGFSPATGDELAALEAGLTPRDARAVMPPEALLDPVGWNRAETAKLRAQHLQLERGRSSGPFILSDERAFRFDEGSGEVLEPVEPYRVNPDGLAWLSGPLPSVQQRERWFDLQRLRASRGNVVPFGQVPGFEKDDCPGCRVVGYWGDGRDLLGPWRGAGVRRQLLAVDPDGGRHWIFCDELDAAIRHRRAVLPVLDRRPSPRGYAGD